MAQNESYRRAGVDIEAGYRAVEQIKRFAGRTATLGALGGLGSFGGLFMPDLSGMREPVLAAGTDGVGTKLKLAFLLDKHDTVGIDCVAMCVNDIICCGAKPLFFLDYLAAGKTVPERAAAIVSGVAEGCLQAGCALIGGETAEMPGFYPDNEYDLAGFAVGIVEKSGIIDGGGTRPGDVLIALPSSGLHSNGFSLARSVLDLSDRALAEELLTPTKIYVKPILALLGAVDVGGISHITGGGFYENLPRMLKPGLTARVEKAAVRTPDIFLRLRSEGDIPDGDMWNTFNMGVGMAVAVPSAQVCAALEVLREQGEEAYVCGEVVKGDDGVLLW
ncbi:MAG: phosphoribosylformylglycinamidine cyclo-ligase [Oscillospiraceae bacterium]|nr:phosphoribosylformylglycinamidine cyclo-ligase [Oscillospiraceae bacterium]